MAKYMPGPFDDLDEEEKPRTGPPVPNMGGIALPPGAQRLNLTARPAVRSDEPGPAPVPGAKPGPAAIPLPPILGQLDDNDPGPAPAPSPMPLPMPTSPGPVPQGTPQQPNAETAPSPGPVPAPQPTPAPVPPGTPNPCPPGGTWFPGGPLCPGTVTPNGTMPAVGHIPMPPGGWPGAPSPGVPAPAPQPQAEAAAPGARPQATTAAAPAPGAPPAAAAPAPAAGAPPAAAPQPAAPTVTTIEAPYGVTRSYGYTPRDFELQGLQPGEAVSMPLGDIYRDLQSGELRVKLNPRGQQALQQATVTKVTEKYGDYPGKDDPNAPIPEVVPGGWDFNPFAPPDKAWIR